MDSNYAIITDPDNNSKAVRLQTHFFVYNLPG